MDQQLLNAQYKRSERARLKNKQEERRLYQSIESNKGIRALHELRLEMVAKEQRKLALELERINTGMRGRGKKQGHRDKWGGSTVQPTSKHPPFPAGNKSHTAHSRPPNLLELLQSKNKKPKSKSASVTFQHHNALPPTTNLQTDKKNDSDDSNTSSDDGSDDDDDVGVDVKKSGAGGVEIEGQIVPHPKVLKAIVAAVTQVWEGTVVTRYRRESSLHGLDIGAHVGKAAGAVDGKKFEDGEKGGDGGVTDTAEDKASLLNTPRGSVSGSLTSRSKSTWQRSLSKILEMQAKSERRTSAASDHDGRRVSESVSLPSVSSARSMITPRETNFSLGGKLSDQDAVFGLPSDSVREDDPKVQREPSIYDAISPGFTLPPSLPMPRGSRPGSKIKSLSSRSTPRSRRALSLTPMSVRSLNSSTTTTPRPSRQPPVTTPSAAIEERPESADSGGYSSRSDVTKSTGGVPDIFYRNPKLHVYNKSRKVGKNEKEDDNDSQCKQKTSLQPLTQRELSNLSDIRMEIPYGKSIVARRLGRQVQQQQQQQLKHKIKKQKPHNLQSQQQSPHKARRSTLLDDDFHQLS